jgi:hypothetical protein
MSVMSRPPGEPRKPPPVTAAPLHPVIAGETCDRGDAPPRHRVLIPYGRDGYAAHRELLFCSHHYARHEAAIAAAGYLVL